MRLNWFEFALMNNPVRAAIQRHLEAPRLLRMGGPMRGGRALEMGCGRGVGASLILDVFQAETVDAFDLDPRMVTGARTRLRSHESRVRLWVGDATAIPVEGQTYDAVFDFGIIHHIPDWRLALREVERVLRPGGRFYAEEVMRDFVMHPIILRLLEHPRADRFDAEQFSKALEDVGLIPQASNGLWGAFAWFTAQKRDAA